MDARSYFAWARRIRDRVKDEGFDEEQEARELGSEIAAADTRRASEDEEVETPWD